MKHSAPCNDIDIREMFDVDNLKMLFINLERRAKAKFNGNNSANGKKAFTSYDVDNNNNNNCNINNRTVSAVSVAVPKIKLHYASTNKMKLKLKNMIKKKFMLS